MATTTAARSTGRSANRGRGPTRSPELDLARALALVAAVVIVVAPGPLPGWVDGRDPALAQLLPATFATIAGVAVACQRAAHGGASSGWWTGRIARRVVVLVAAGLLLQLLVLLPDPGEALQRLRWTGDLARLGVASGLGLLLVRLPAQVRGALVVVLAGAYSGLLLAGDAGPAAGGAMAGWDAQLLGGRARTPIDPDGVTALAPTLALVLVGAELGRWLLARSRGAPTVLRLLATAGLAGTAGWLLADAPWAGAAAPWTPAVLLGGIAVTLLLLALGQAGTRRAWSDRLVAEVAVAGRVTLPLWLAAVVGEAWLGGTPPVRWIVREVLWPPLGSVGASLALGLLVAVGLLRLGAALVDRGHQLRA